MNKNILIGSVIVVAILVGVSLTSVVGYQSVEYSLKESPLFNVRSGRAIEKGSNEVTCDYVGKGIETNLNVPELNNRIDKIDALITAIKMMDDKSLKIFANYIALQLKQSHEFQAYTSEDIFQTLMQLKENPDIIIHQIEQQEDSRMMSNICTYYITCEGPQWRCDLVLLLFVIAVFISWFIITPILIVIAYFIPTMLRLKPQCDT